jgi:hypothetical protein
MCVLPMEILMIFSSWIDGVASGQIVGGTTALPLFVTVDDIKRREHFLCSCLQQKRLLLLARVSSERAAKRMHGVGLRQPSTACPALSRFIFAQFLW